jgi:hypothetical protein
MQADCKGPLAFAGTESLSCVQAQAKVEVANRSLARLIAGATIDMGDQPTALESDFEGRQQLKIVLGHDDSPAGPGLYGPAEFLES